MPLTPELAVLAAIGTCLGGAAVVAFVSRWRDAAGWLAALVTLVAAAFAGAAAVQVLATGPGHAAAFLQLPRWGFALRLHVDGLTALFLLLTAIVSVPVAVYSVPYLAHHADGNAARYHPWFLLFLAAMYGLLSTTDMMWFFGIFWQLMTWPGFALIQFDRREPAHRIAARRYLVMMQIACLATMAGAELLADGAAAVAGTDPGALRYDFATVSAGVPALLRARPLASALAFALFLVGFGIKMGMWPFGRIWLPDAHPAAPSPVSAMLSGVMIKTGVYGLARYFLWLVPEEGREVFPLGTWGGIIVGLGVVTLLTGTVQALFQERSKRLLAFSSIGQVGYLLLGIGTTMVLLAGRDPRLTGLAAIAVSATLFHVLNHGVLKALLFLDAGAVLQATGTQELSRLGGLLRRMPFTGATALLAAFALAGLPLFSGYASKWGLYVATAGAARSSALLPLAGAVAILTSALTLAVALKFVGATFLGRTSELVRRAASRPGAPEKNLEVSLPQRFAQGTLALFALAAGLAPAGVLLVIQRALDASREGFGGTLADAAHALARSTDGLGMAGPVEGATFAPLSVALVLGLLLLLALALARAGGAARRADAPWLCGYAHEAECHRHAAAGWTRELGRLLGLRPAPLPPRAGGAAPPPHS